MEISLDDIKLDDIGREAAIKLAELRYNPNTNRIKLTCDQYRSRVLNHKRCCNMLRDLVEMADKISKEEKAAGNTTLSA